MTSAVYLVVSNTRSHVSGRITSTGYRKLILYCLTHINFTNFSSTDEFNLLNETFVWNILFFFFSLMTIELFPGYAILPTGTLKIRRFWNDIWWGLTERAGRWLIRRTRFIAVSRVICCLIWGVGYTLTSIRSTMNRWSTATSAFSTLRVSGGGT